MFSKTKIALSAAMVLSTAFSASAATKHHRVTHVYNMVPAAQSDQIPVLDVNPVCHGIASQSELEAGLQRTSFQQCVQSEQATREQLKKEWSTFTTSDKTNCVALAKTGGESSYTELITCMEMARDVRELHKQADSSSAPVPEGLPAPVGHRQPTESSTPTPTPTSPAPAASSQPPSTNEPPNTGADSTLKELERGESGRPKRKGVGSNGPGQPR
jgi:hypothetical protein